MRRIAVLGCAGSGKTTLSRALGERLGLPVIHIDNVYQRTDGEFAAEWPAMHRELIARDAWIIDGMKPGVLGERLDRADTAIFLDMPRRICYRGLLERRLALRGRARPDLGLYDGTNPAQIRWIWRFSTQVRPVVLEHLRACACDVVTLSSRADVRRLLGEIPARGPATPIGAHS